MSLVVFTGNCQARALSQFYETFVAPARGETVRYVESYQDLTDAGRSDLKSASVIVEQQLFMEPRARADEVNRSSRRVLFPLVTCAFLWPNAGEARPGNVPTWYLSGGPFPGELSDRFLNGLIRQERSPEFGLEAYLAADITHNLERRFELYMGEQQRRDELCDFSIAPVITEHFRTEPLFFTPHHPGLRITMALAEQLFEKLGAADAIPALRERVWRSPFPWGRLPIHPKVSAHFGLSFVDESTTYRYSQEGLFTFRQWVLLYMRGDWSPDLREGIAETPKDPEQALEKLHRGLRAFPDSPDGNFAKGDALRRLGRLNEALPAHRRAVSLVPDDPQFHYGLSVCLHAMEQWREAQEEAQVAVFQDPGNPHYYAALAHAARGNKDWATAEHAAREALTLDPRNSHLHNLLGHVMGEVGRLDAAEESVRKAINLEPHRAGFHDHLATILIHQSRTEEGLSHAAQAAVLEPDNLHFALVHAIRLKDLGLLEEAEAATRKACANAPGTAAPYDFLGHLLAKMERLDEAIHAFQEADRLEPDHAPRLSALSHSLTRAGRNAEALAAIRTAVKVDSRQANYFAHLGNLLRQMGENAEAETALTRALELVPDHAFARTLLEEIRRDNAPAAEEGNDRTAIGKDGWLFHRIDAVFEQVCEGNGLSEGDQERILSLWESRLAWCEARGMAYRILIAPERHVLYPDKLPDGFAPSENRPVLRLIRAADARLRSCIIYPDAAIRAGRAEREICYRTDVHWSRWGAYLAYRELLNSLPQSCGPAIEPDQLTASPGRVLGDMTMWLERRDREQVEFLDPPPVQVTEVFTNRTFKPGQVDVFETDRHDRPHLVLFRTSNSTHLLPFLNHHFSRIVALASTSMHYDLLRSERPNIVISEVSERYLAAPDERPGFTIRFPEDYVGRTFSQFTGVELPLPRGDLPPREQVSAMTDLERVARTMCARDKVPETQWHLYLAEALQSVAATGA